VTNRGRLGKDEGYSPYEASRKKRLENARAKRENENKT
jgi:hypothetical protein